MAENIPEPGTDSLLPTRRSLLSRLRDWQDQEGWREFFDTYWRLIYNVARNSGLADAEAQDVVQNTFIYLALSIVHFRKVTIAASGQKTRRESGPDVLGPPSRGQLIKAEIP